MMSTNEERIRQLEQDVRRWAFMEQKAIREKFPQASIDWYKERLSRARSALDDAQLRLLGVEPEHD